MWSIADLLKLKETHASGAVGSPPSAAVCSQITKPGNSTPRCDQCRYYVSVNDAGTPDAPIKRGECHRYPPDICVDMNSRIRLVLAQWWCGEFKREET